MAERLKFRHAIYDTFNFQRGYEQTFDEGGEELRRLLQHGDGVLDRDNGFFFRHVKGEFVVAFESRRTDELSRKGSKRSKGWEWYFDVFWTPVQRVESIHIADVVEELDARCSDSYEADIDDIVFIEPSTYDELEPKGGADATSNREPRLPGRSGQEGNEDGEDDFVHAEEGVADMAADDPAEQSIEGNDMETAGVDSPRQEAGPDQRPDTEFLAQFWEQKRRNGVQMYAEVAHIDRFNYAVDGVLKKIDFVSTERKKNKTFDIVGGDFEYKIDASDLEDRLRRLRADNRLSVDEIPSYTEVLEERINRHRSELQEGDLFSEQIDQLVEDLRSEIESSVATVEGKSAETFWKAYSGEWGDDEQDDSLLTGVTNVVPSGRNNDDPPYVAQLSGETVSDETVDRIVDEIVREEIEDSLRARREEILNRVDRNLQSLEEKVRRELTETIIERIDDIRTSEVYQRVDSSERNEPQ